MQDLVSQERDRFDGIERVQNNKTAEIKMCVDGGSRALESCERIVSQKKFQPRVVLRSAFPI
jgi:hypothetical protein